MCPRPPTPATLAGLEAGQVRHHLLVSRRNSARLLPRKRRHMNRGALINFRMRLPFGALSNFITRS